MIFNVGDKVYVSAQFLRSIDINAAKGWPTTYDPGEGTIFETLECYGTYLITAYFPQIKRFKTYNSGNLIKPDDRYNEAMRAEHRS